ncbi:uncharacterized protein LOC116027055 [Ipomoea triloba]|uniref:uncharacterized protein LOC116027055 n=1 Tax=Ipomoea triloba TaxID=35885 RepID=UPI00125D3137|nr:uncharacterized protein LOC116027055 [Ipomoea triloba]
MKVITWNCQGAASKSFLRVAKWLINKHHPDILCLVETKTSGCNADAICMKLGFEKWARVEALGFSGDIWILCPSLHLRRRLWSSLRRDRVRVDHPWLVAGDFNAIAHNDECSNDNSPGYHRNGDFRNWIFDEALVDLGFSGQKFTWKRGNDEGTFKGARLDRALCSLDWCTQMKDTKVVHLPAFGSDHCPVLIEFDKKIIKGQRRFMFQGAWTTHHAFLDLIKKSWNENDTVWQTKDNMIRNFQVWNRNVFGNIHHRKQKLLNRLEGIQRQMDHAGHAGLTKLDKKIRKELEETLQQEEILWFQQAREEWIASGDRNTKFYHAATKCKKAKR